MIQTDVKGLEEALNHVIDIVKQKNQPQLLSYTYTINDIDPISFFENGKSIDGDRLFWASTIDDFYLVGVGEAHRIAESDNRFRSAEIDWKMMLDNTITFNSYRKPGTGPIAFGGFSFDPAKKSTELWEHYGDSQFRIPSFLLTVNEGIHYLTVNVLVRPEDHAGQLYFHLDKNKEELLMQRSNLGCHGKSTIKTKHEINPNGWKDLVSKATDRIKNGEASKIVLAREMRVTFDRPINIGSVIQDLIQAQTNSYVFAFENELDCFLGATPERLVRVEDEELLSTCLAGTAPRGRTEEEDVAIGQTLLNDLKNLEEHEFVVRMIKDAVAECCETIVVPEKPVLYPLKNLQHLYTPVKAKLKSDYSLFHVVEKLHPTPALGGAPQDISLAFIRKYEEMDRGWYGAPIGWIDAYQNGEFAVAIRSALIKKQKEASLFAGCGVVKESDPESEYDETNIKFTPMLSVLGGDQ